MLNYLKKLVERDSTADKEKILQKEGIEKSNAQKRNNQREKLMQEWRRIFYVLDMIKAGQSKLNAFTWVAYFLMKYKAVNKRENVTKCQQQNKHNINQNIFLNIKVA